MGYVLEQRRNDHVGGLVVPPIEQQCWYVDLVQLRCNIPIFHRPSDGELRRSLPGHAVSEEPEPVCVWYSHRMVHYRVRFEAVHGLHELFRPGLDANDEDLEEFNHGGFVFWRIGRAVLLMFLDRVLVD